MVRIPLLISLLFLLTKPGLGQDASVNKDDLKKSVRALTSGVLSNRQTGTTGQREAAIFISKKFKASGLSPFDSMGYFQKIDLVKTYWGEVYLKTGDRKLQNFDNMISMGHAIQKHEIAKSVVFGGNGKPEQLNQIEVEDKVVLVFIENLRAFYDVSQSIKKRKAFGIILANPTMEIQFESMKKNFKDYVLQKRFSIPGRDSIQDTISYIHEFLIPNSEVKTIMGVSIRDLQKYIDTNTVGSCPQSSLQIKCEKIKEKVETENVIGIIKGKRDQSILLSAHYDTYNHAGQNPGADDNASGVATLFELAESLLQDSIPPVNIIFLTTTGEEDGLIGSRFYASSQDFSSRKILFNLNVDMIGRTDDKHNTGANYLYCVGNAKNSLLDKAILAAGELNDRCAFDDTYYNSKDNSFQYRGDHASFLEKRIPAVMFFGGLHDDYHQPGDSSDKINYKLLESRALLIQSVLNQLLMLLE